MEIKAWWALQNPSFQLWVEFLTPATGRDGQNSSKMPGLMAEAIPVPGALTDK
jgi:hypothetical protein